jgi:hypothetical protein
MTPHPSEVTQAPEIDPWTALRMRFHENRDNFPAEQLGANAGPQVGWWPDGSRIFDADDNYQALFQRLRAAGYADSFFMFEPIPLPEQTEIDPYVALCMRFSENRNNFPAAELAKYGGKLVAWWPDGSRIVDADTVGDGHAFFQRLRDTGHDLSFFVLEHLPFPDESFV